MKSIFGEIPNEVKGDFLMKIDIRGREQATELIRRNDSCIFKELRDQQFQL